MLNPRVASWEFGRGEKNCTPFQTSRRVPELHPFPWKEQATAPALGTARPPPHSSNCATHCARQRVMPCRSPFARPCKSCRTEYLYVGFGDFDSASQGTARGFGGEFDPLAKAGPHTQNYQRSAIEDQFLAWGIEAFGRSKLSQYPTVLCPVMLPGAINVKRQTNGGRSLNSKICGC